MPCQVPKTLIFFIHTQTFPRLVLAMNYLRVKYFTSAVSAAKINHAAVLTALTKAPLSGLSAKMHR